jgi:hypothetical protein
MKDVLTHPTVHTWGFPEPEDWLIMFPNGRMENLLDSEYVKITFIWGKDWPLFEVAAIDMKWHASDEWWCPDWQNKKIAEIC